MKVVSERELSHTKKKKWSDNWVMWDCISLYSCHNLCL